MKVNTNSNSYVQHLAMIVVAAFTTLAIVSSLGCAAGPYARHGAVGGGLAGGAIGALAGAPSERSLEGAAIGAVTGSVLGNVVGDMADQDAAAYQNEKAAYLQQAQSQALTIPQVIQMNSSGVGDQLIINQMQANGVIAQLTANDIISLKQNGVSDAVIGAWQSMPPIGSPRLRSARVRPVIVQPILEPAYGPGWHYGPRHHCPPGWH